MIFDIGQALNILFTIAGAGVAAYIAVSRQIWKTRLQISNLRTEMLRNCEEKRSKLRAELGGEIKEVTGVHRLVKNPPGV